MRATIPAGGDGGVAAAHLGPVWGVEDDLSPVSGGTRHHREGAASQVPVEEELAGGVVGSPIADSEVHRDL